MDLTIIIPVLNEADNLGRILTRLESSSEVEVIVVDGGSSDDTVAIAKSYGHQVIISQQRGRAFQMNLGAAKAKGDILLFLHADTLLPSNYLELIRQTIAQPETIAGAFRLQIQGEQKSLRLIETLVNLRSHYLSFPYGDQGIFLLATTFKTMGGFPLIPIMEDFELIYQLRRRGKIKIIPQSVLTSGRRWQRLGVFKTTLINQLIILGYLWGISPEKLAKFYTVTRR